MMLSSTFAAAAAMAADFGFQLSTKGCWTDKLVGLQKTASFYRISLSLLSSKYLLKHSGALHICPLKAGPVGPLPLFPHKAPL